MKRVFILLVVACGPKQGTATAEPTAATPAPAASADGDPMLAAYEAATAWNMSMNGGPELSDEEKEALQTKAIENLKLACEQKEQCACNALQTGMCNCPDEAMCTGEPFWFAGEQ